MGNTILNPDLLLELAHTVNVGLVLIGPEEEVLLWNRWLEERSGVTAAQILGRPLAQAFPQLANSRLEHAVKTALSQRLPAVLSQTLNRRPFPLQNHLHSDAPPLEQAITIAPLDGPQGQNYCLIQIQDVTPAVRRERQLREQAQQLYQLSNIDSLTGVANRRSFDARFQEEFQRAQRHGTVISLLMLDIDFFKQYNDYYGHQAGDRCLTAVATALNGSLQRGGDFVARYGGEEFAIVLPGCDREGALHLAKTLQERIGLLGMRHQASETADHVTISQGIAAITPLRSDRAADLLHAADQALYQAKSEGRNRIVCATSPAAPATPPAPSR